jgi:hypothetical protein
MKRTEAIRLIKEALSKREDTNWLGSNAKEVLAKALGFVDSDIVMDTYYDIDCLNYVLKILEIIEES